MLLTRSIKRKIWLVPLMVSILAYTTYIFVPSPVIVSFQNAGYVDKTENILSLLLIIFCSFVFTDKNEIELALVCGTSTEKLFFYRVLPIWMSAVISLSTLLLVHRSSLPRDNNVAVIPIHVPDNYKQYLFVSLVVTVTFFFALYCVIRVLSRNCFVPLFVCIFLKTVIDGFNGDIQRGMRDIRFCIIDPFISDYILGDAVPNTYAEQMKGMEIMRNAWTYNRIGFFAIGVVLLVVTYLLLRREKLHKGFGD